jgi:transcriptional regulator with XRE-family HTH domain
MSIDVQSMGWTRQEFAANFQLMLEERYRRLGAEVRRLRERQGLSQEVLAQRADVSVKTVSRIETGAGAHEHRGSTYRKLAAALDIPVSRLLDLVMLGDPERPGADGDDPFDEQAEVQTLRELGLGSTDRDARQDDEAQE